MKITFKETKVFNIEGAMRGMRNPLNSWPLSDTTMDSTGNSIIGPNDLALARRKLKPLDQANALHEDYHSRAKHS